MESLGRAYLRLKVRDPAVREQLTPQYAIGCKRPGFHNSYLSTFNRDNVRLVTEPIDKITPSAVATTDGANHEIDVLVLATGFKVLDSDSHADLCGHRQRRPVADHGSGTSIGCRPTRESAFPAFPISSA